MDNEKYYDYCSQVLYVSYVRSALQLVHIKNTNLFEEAISISQMCSMLKYMDDRFEDYDRKKLQFYVYVSLLSYIPYDKNSIIYYQEKLNNSMVEEKKLHVARAKNAINTLLRDDIVLDNEEISEIYDMYDQLSNNKFKKNLPGIIALTVQTNLNLLYQDKKNKTIEYIRNMYENSKSDEINLEDYFELNEYPLTEDRKMYLDSIVELQTKLK